MKYFLAIVSLLSCSCSSPPVESKEMNSASVEKVEFKKERFLEKLFQSDYENKVSLKTLEKLEQSDPNNSEIKLRMSRLLFCQKRYGESLNALFWIHQFTEDKELKILVTQWIRDYKTENFQIEVSKNFKCSR